MVDWAALQDLIDRCDEAAVASVLRGLEPEQRRDPRLAELIPRLLKVDVVAAWFDTPRSRNGDGWPTALNMLAAEGLVDRAMLLGSCLAGLRRGGRPGATRGLLRLHDELAPTLGEVRSRARDYLALLSGTRSTVAGMAQRQPPRPCATPARLSCCVPRRRSSGPSSPGSTRRPGATPITPATWCWPWRPHSASSRPTCRPGR